MRILSLELNNFLSYQKQKVDFSDGVTVFVGRNGAGKTSLLEAVLWSLYGESRSKSDIDLLRLGQKKFSVKLVFECNEEVYTIVRSRDKVKSELRFFKGQGDELQEITASTLKDTQVKINNIVKLDYKSFLVSVYFGQEQVGMFSEFTPAERKNVLRKILDLDWFDKCLQIVKDDAKKIELDLEKIAVKKEILKNDVVDESFFQKQIQEHLFSIENLIKEKETIDKELKEIEMNYNSLLDRKKDKEKLLKILSELEDLNIQKNDLKNKIEQLLLDRQSFDKKILELNERLVVLENEKQLILKTLEGLEEENKELELKKENLLKEIEDRKIQLKLVEEKINSFRNSYLEIKDMQVCYVCKTKIDSDKKKNILDDIVCQGQSFKLKQEELNKELGVFMADFQLLQEKLEEMFQDLKKKRDELQQKEKEVISLSKDIDAYKQKVDFSNYMLSDVRKNLDFLEKTLTDKEKEIEELKKRVDEFKEEDFDILEKQKKEKEELLFKLDDSIQQLKLELELTKDKLEKSQEAIKELRQLEQVGEQIKQTLKVGDVLQEVFGKNGFSVVLMEQALRQIEFSANKYLQELSDNNLTVQFDTKKELKSGQEVDSLEIVISDELGRRNYNLFSGGEKMRISIALRLALADYLCSRHNTRVECLFIDEGFVSLDDIGLDSFCVLIKNLASRFKQIFVITHLPQVKAFFDNVKIVEKKNGISFIL